MFFFASSVCPASPKEPQTAPFNRRVEFRSLACQPDQSAATAKYGHKASCGPTDFARHRYFTQRRARARSTTRISGA